MKAALTATLLVFAVSVTAWAGKTPVNISEETNSSWCGEKDVSQHNCSTFPSGNHTYEGVTFQIPTVNNAWFAEVAADYGPGTVSVTIPVNVEGVKTVYTLMNTTYGSTTPGLASITFNGTGDASWTYNLTGGIDIRDYNYNTSTTYTLDCALPLGTTKREPGTVGTVPAWNNAEGQRLDMQIFELPTSFADQTLQSVTITDSSPGDTVQRIFIAAMTVSTSAP